MTAPPNHVRDLREARVIGRADAREAILAAAALILSEEGPSALTLRRVAVAVNASTKVIYTSFGGKDGLLDALYLHSFAGLERLLAAKRAIESAPARILAMCDAYREYALASPAFYNVMFGDFGRDFTVPVTSRRQALATFQIMRDAISTALPRERAEHADVATRLLWAAMHGVVSLEMHHLLGDPSQRQMLFDQAITAASRTYGIELPARIP